MPGNVKQQKEVVIISTKNLQAGTKVVNLLGTKGVQRPVGTGSGTWITYWEKLSRQQRVCCSAEGCDRDDRISGGHVKIANGPITAALFETDWYIIPTCPDHNKGSSCKTFRVKAVTAVMAPPSAFERFRSWEADIDKLVNHFQGKR